MVALFNHPGRKLVEVAAGSIGWKTGSGQSGYQPRKVMTGEVWAVPSFALKTPGVSP